MESALATINAILNANIRMTNQISKCRRPDNNHKKHGDIIEHKNDINIDDVPLYSLKEISCHCSTDSCWIVIKDLVYDVTCFLKEHPAGGDIILESAGRDATNAFGDVSHSKDAHKLLKKYFIGALELHERLYINNVLPS